jgi:DNA-directed RNA polymerase subunit RPC12/RpoP
MTRQEFISKQQAYKNISGKGAVIAVSLVFGFSILVVSFCVFISVVRDHLKTVWIQYAVTAILSTALAIFVLVSFQLLVRHFRLRMIKFGLICTGCGAPLVGASSRAAIATGNCRRCGKKIIDEIPAA